MPFIPFAAFLALFAGCVTAQSNVSIHSLTVRQANASTADCNTLCTNYQEMQANCTVLHCGCNVPFIQSQGQCLVCQTSTPQDAATVQILLDTEINQCRREGINIGFQLDLSPTAAAIVQKFNRDSAVLRRSQTAFLALQIAGGHIGLAFVLAFAIFSRRVRRDATFLNFCITWIFSSIFFSILLYRGTDGHTVTNSLGEVSQNECLAQAVLTKGAQVMTSCSTLVLVIQLWLRLRLTLPGKSAYGSEQSQWITCAFIVIPYIFFISFALPSVLVGTGNVVVQGTQLNKAIPTNFYCAVLELHPTLQAVDSVTLGLVLITIVFDALIMNFLYKYWRAFRHVKMNNTVSLSCLLRVMAFSLYRVAVAVAYVQAILTRMSPVNSRINGVATSFSVPIWTDLLEAAIPLVAFLIFAINPDAIKDLVFWRRFRVGSTSKGQLTNVMNVSATTVGGNGNGVIEANNKFVSASV